MKGYISIILGIVFCVSVLVGYIPIPEYIVELTCISNTLIGILLIFSGVDSKGIKCSADYEIQKKSLEHRKQSALGFRYGF